jgi:transcriptional regulator EpsA
MNMIDFNFVNQREKSAVAESSEKSSRNGSRGTTLLMPKALRCAEDDDDGLLRIVKHSLQIKSHRELFQFLQGKEIQQVIPHQVLVSAWGDFNGPDLKFDVISAIPGVRTGLLSGCTIGGLLKDLYHRWLVHGRQPLLLSSADLRLGDSSTCDCALHKSLQRGRSVLVHGVTDARDGNHSLYLASNANSIVNGRSIERFRSLVEPLIAQVDVAFRRVAALKMPASSAKQEAPASSPRVLSAREEGILLLVAEGKSNAEISEILAISACTVKNHMQRIMKKLNAANRTEAVAKYRPFGGSKASPQTLTC